MLPTTEPIFVCQTSVVSSVCSPLMTQQPDQKFVSPRPTYKPAIDMIDAAAQIQASGEQIADRRRHRRSKLFVFHVQGRDCMGCAAAMQKYR